MELREYWEILVQRKWIIIGLALLALVASMALSARFTAPYKASIRMAFKPQIDSRSEKYFNYDEYYAYVASEYLIDDVIEVVESRTFREELQSKLQGRTGEIPDKAIQAKKTHRVMIVNVTAGSDNEALLITRTIGELLTEPDNKYFARLSYQNPTVTIVDAAQVTSPGEGRRALDLALRTVLGLVAGVGLALLLDYLAGKIRGTEYVERTIGLPVLGEIPREPARRRRK